MPLNHTQEEALFNATRRIHDRAERAAYLREACHDDELRGRVAALLSIYDKDQELLQSAGPSVAATTLADTSPEQCGTMIGPYKLREVLGEGGMGIVYVAEQEKPIRRKVALKVIKPGMDTREVIGRFEAERQALALMDHPNIAKVLDAGTTGGEVRNAEFGVRNEDRPDAPIPHSEFRTPNSPSPGRPYFVMELVRGMPITEYCDKRRLLPRERLKLFITVCQAVQHAHQRGIIHRDLKPSNVMITLHDGVPVPKVIDFGVAKALNQKLTEHTLYTRHAQMVGTPLYMSPEQAELSGLEIDTRSDVYSLGVLLYELLTGHTPFDKETFSKVGFDEMRRMIREDEPPRPSHRVSTLAAQARSTVSNQRGMDERQLSRALHGELDWIVMKALEKDRTRRYGSADALAADVQRFLDDKPVEACPPSIAYRLRKFVRRKRNALTMTAILAVCVPLVAYEVFRLVSGAGAIPQNGAPLTSAAVTTRPSAAAPGRDLPGLVPEPLFVPEIGRWQLITKKPRGVIRSAVWSPDEKQIALAEANHVRIYDATNAQLMHVLVAHSQPVRSVAWHPDGQRLASASEDGTVRLWTSEGVPTHLLIGHSGPVYQVAWRPDGEQLASASADGTVRLWTSDGSPVRVLDEAGRHVFGIDWTTDGKLLASVGGDIRPAGPDGNPGDNSVRVWDVDSGSLIRKFDARTVKFSALCVDWRPDGKQLAVGYGDMYRSTGANSGSTLTPVPDAGVRICNIDGTPGPTLIRESDLETASQFGTIYALEWDPAGARLAFCGRMGGVRLWNAGDQSFSRTSTAGKTDSFSISWKRDGSGLLAASRDSVREWNPDRGEAEVVTGLSGQSSFVVKWSPDGQTVATSRGGLTLFLDANGKPAKQPDRPADTVPAWWEVASQTRRPDGAPGPTLEGSFPNMREWAWSKSGWLAGAAWADASVRIWNDQGKLVATLKGYRGGVESVDWSPDGQWLGYGAGESVRLWKVDGTPGPVMTGHTDEVYPVAWSPDGKWIASGSTDSTIRLWKPDGTAGPIFRGHQGGIHDLAWSPDSTRIASASWLDATLRVWNVETGKTEWQALRLESNTAVTLSASGQPLHGDRDLFEPHLLTVVEERNGRMDILSFGSFRRQYGVTLVNDLADRCKRASATKDWPLAETAFAEALTFLADGSPSVRNQISVVARGLANALNKTLSANGAAADEYGRADEIVKTALEISLALVADAPENATFKQSLGNAYFTRGNIRQNTRHFDEAIDDYTKTAELSPAHSGAYNNRGNVWDDLRQIDKAIADYTKAIEVNPRDWMPYANRGRKWLHFKNEFDKAVADFTKVIELRPQDSRLWLLRGVAWQHLGQIESARADYAKAAELAATSGSAVECNNVAWSLATCFDLRFRDHPRALELARKAHSLAPRDINILGTLGTAEYRMGHWSAALEASGKAVAMRTDRNQFDRGWATDVLIVAMAHWQLGQKQEAVEWYDKAAAWMEKNSSQDEGRQRFRAEAAELLGRSVDNNVAPDPRPETVPPPEDPGEGKVE